MAGWWVGRRVPGYPAIHSNTGVSEPCSAYALALFEYPKRCATRTKKTPAIASGGLILFYVDSKIA